MSFYPKSIEDEYKLVRTRLGRLQTYLAPLIELAIRRADLNSVVKQRVQIALNQDIPKAAGRFLSRWPNGPAPYIFSTYFTWYIAERINSEIEFADGTNE